jgi:hypothetical protein
MSHCTFMARNAQWADSQLDRVGRTWGDEYFNTETSLQAAEGVLLAAEQKQASAWGCVLHSMQAACVGLQRQTLH